MQQEIRAHYLKLVLPAVVCCLAVFILESININVFLGQVSKTGTVVFLVLSVLFSFVFPLWFRILFVRKVKGQRDVSAAQLLRFEKTFLLIAELSLYIVLIAYLWKVPKMQMLFIALFGFYAAYYYFPSRKRIDHEKQLFRVKGQGGRVKGQG